MISAFVTKGLKEEMDIKEQNLKSFSTNAEFLEMLSSQTENSNRR